MVRDAASAAEKRQRKIGVSTEDYREGVENPREDWVERVKQTSEKRDAALRKAMDEDRINKGVVECGTDKQIRKTLEKGAPNWATQSVTPEANEAYARGMEPVIDCVSQAKKAIAEMPQTTRDQRIARSAKYQQVMGACMDKKKGVKA